jgi:hypothetical protein
MSGAYIFRPDSKTFSKPQSYQEFTESRLFEGNNIVVLALYGPKAIVHVKFYKSDEDHYLSQGFEIETLVGPIDVSDG